MDQSYKAGIAAAVAAGMSLWSAQASAGFYVGGGIGDSTIETSENFDDGAINFDESDFGYKIFGGYMFSEYLGVEASYIDLGSPSQSFGFDGGESGFVNYDFRAELTGFTLQGVAAYPFGDVFEVNAKLGMVSYDAEIEAKETVSGDRLKLEDDGEELAYGIGGKYRVGNFALRADWDIYDVGDIDDVSMWTIGAQLSF
jgi:hypothetical protein